MTVGNESGAAGGPRAGLIGNVPRPVALLAATLAIIYVGLEFSPPPLADYISDRFGLAPTRLVAPAHGVGGLLMKFAPVATHVFLHASIAHLLFNLLWLFVFGAPVARRLQGPLRFYLFFLLSGAAGGLFFSLFHLNEPTLLVGASGGVTGLLGGLVRFAFHRPGANRPRDSVLPLTDRSVLWWSAVVILMNASVAIFGPNVGAGEADIAWQAHVGGFLFGVLAFPLFDRRRG
jgi:membrane associated rhomboid family serine protease